SSGHSLVTNVLRSNFAGKIYPVNPRSPEVLGITAYPSIEHVPPGVDLAVIAVRSSLVPDVLQQCGNSRVKTAMIVTDGFADGGEEGRRLQKSVTETGRRCGIRMIGPNTQGFFNADRNLLVLTGSAIAPSDIKRADVSIVAQTGLFLGGWMVRGMTPEGIGMSKSIDVGNMCDLDHTDFLAYLGVDPSTKAIVMHMDRLDRATEFMRIAKTIVPRKPVIVVKAGKSPAAREAIFSHTGSLAQDDSVFDTMCRQAGVLRADDYDEIEDLVRTSLFLHPLAGKRVGIINFSGAAGEIAADACARFGLEMARLSETTIKRIAGTLPSHSSVKNPVDFMQSFEVDARKTLKVAIEALLDDPDVDGIALIVVVMSTPPISAYLDIVKEAAAMRPDKPISMWALGDEGSTRDVYGLAGQGIVAYPTVTRAVKALATSYAQWGPHQPGPASNRLP
ncbi:MAG: CoA-binding protein, partial [Chloroflexi bacterium]|nr:CoA-binding protein [Chloroflexota bacterium]